MLTVLLVLAVLVLSLEDLLVELEPEERPVQVVLVDLVDSVLFSVDSEVVRREPARLRRTWWISQKTRHWRMKNKVQTGILLAA